MNPRRKWTAEDVISDAKAIATSLGYFPSVSELRVMGRNDLSVQITRHGGFIAIASEVGIPRKHSDSDTGWEGEVAARAILIEHGFSVTRSQEKKAPYDLLVDGCARCDVKTASYSEYGNVRGWFYRIGKVPTCDLILLYQADTRNCFLIPWHLVPTTNITISRDGGKYARFLNNWEILKSVIGAMKIIRAA